MNSNASLSGSLSFMGLVDLIQLLGTNGSSGVLRVQSKYASGPGTVYFYNGNPVDASSGSLKGLDALFSLFGWTEGEFEFKQDNIERPQVIKSSRMEVILDGLKKLDDGQIEKLGPEALVKSVADGSGKATTPLIKGPLIDYNYVVDEEEYYDGSMIVEEGKHGNWMWVILEGVVDIVKETSKEPLTIVKIGAGAFIGSMASFLLEGHKRNASAVASGRVQLGVLDSQRISGEYARLTSSFKGILRALENRLYQVTERVASNHQDPIKVADVIKNSKLLLKQGENQKKLFIINKGTAYIVRSAAKTHTNLAILDKDDYFGYIPFLDMGHEPLSASVFGTEDIEFDELNLDDIQKEYDTLSPTIKHIIENIAMSISVTTKLLCDKPKK